MIQKQKCFLVAAFFFVCVVGALLNVSCKKDSDTHVLENEALAPKVSSEKNSEYAEIYSDEYWVYNSNKYKHFDDFFTPLYKAEKPEPPHISEKVALVSAKPTEKNNTSIIPGIRNLSDYKTVYARERVVQAVAFLATNAMTNATSTEKNEISTPRTADNGTMTQSENSSLKISDWGPQNNIPSEILYPTFYVVFSQPVRSLEALEESSNSSPVMSIDPPLKGVFRWYGTRHISFEAAEQARPGVEYTISVNDTVTSTEGTKLEGTRVFKTTAVNMAIEQLFPGSGSGGMFYGYDSASGLPPNKMQYFGIMLNYQLTIDEFNSSVSVSVNNAKKNFKAEGVFDKKIYNAVYTADAGKTNTFNVIISDTIPRNSLVNVTAVTMAGGASDTKNYHTIRPFIVSEWRKQVDRSSRERQNLFSIDFSQGIDIETVFGNITTEPSLEITKNNIEVRGKKLLLFNLPVELNTEYQVIIGKNLRDIYGQYISVNTAPIRFKVPEASSYVRFLDYGVKMLEAQYPHKILFEYQNALAGSYYMLQATNDPLSSSLSNKDWLAQSSLWQPLNISTRNTRQFIELDLDPYLINGRGSVRFDAKINTLGYLYWKDEEYVSENSNYMTVQVTDLGITVRLGINRAVVLVRSLSTNKPVQDAEVFLYENTQYASDVLSLPEDGWIARGLTNKNGLAVIEISNETARKMEQTQKSIALWVKSHDDSATFFPTTHSAWKEGVSTSSLYNARQFFNRTFLFSDRGLYKPGETITIRGIDRNQHLGNLSPYVGAYKLILEKSSWSDTTKYGSITGETSQSGGFWAQFTLPEDLEPGAYRVRYYRTAGDYASNTYETLYFTVAYFERLKIQSEIVIPDVIFYGGDTIQATLSASYLAGGTLAGAKYESTWFREPSSFTPNAIELKGYSFGPQKRYESRNEINEVNGQLSSVGSARLMCNTTAISNGMPYIYRVEAAVTDESNQQISTMQQTLVHPARFYIGIAQPSNLSGFAKKGQKLDFPYVLAAADGKKLSSLAMFESITAGKPQSGSIQYELYRETWTLVQEKSVNNAIYTRYQRHETKEDTGYIKPKVSGFFSITPQNSGWYTLRLTAYDRYGNKAETDYGFYATGSDASWWNSDNSDSLRLTPSQSEYNPGDTAQVLLESPLPAGDYLITVEREGIFTEELRHFDTACSVLEIPIASNYVPVVYVSVSSYSVRNGQPTHNYGEVDLDKPKGYYGVTPLFINPRVRAFSVKVESDKSVYRPGETATLTMTATKEGKPLADAELTLMAVDRGVLDLINYHVPDPIAFFYDPANFPLRVYGGDSRALLIDPVTYSIKTLQGGDSGEESKDDERKDFRPTALFEPMLITGADGKVTCSFTVPDSLTTYRITAFGVKNDQFALQENEIIVQNPINVQSVQPRRLRVRDTAECGVLLTNLDNKAHRIKVSVQVRDPETVIKQNAALGRKTIHGSAFIDGKNEHTITVQGGSSSVVYFDLASEKEGTIELVYTISSDVLNEKLVSPLIIEQSYVYETVTMIGTLGEGNAGNESITEGFIIPSFAKDGQGSISITLDATRLGLLGSAVNYVFAYPYGCLEQQSSQVLPLLIFEKYIDVFGLDSHVSDVRTCVSSFFKSWKNDQRSDGGFPYWSGGTYSDYYVSLRIAHIYALALERGYTKAQFPINIDRLLAYLKSYINSTATDDYLKAYACYVFALLGDNSLNSVLKSVQERNYNNDLSILALTGLSYAKQAAKTGASADTRRLADQAAQNIRSYMQPVERSVSITQPHKSAYSGMFYNSRINEMALIMQLFVELNSQDEMVDRLLYTLLQTQKGGYWTNTAVTARVLESVYTLIQKRNLDATDFIAHASIEGTQLARASFSGVAAKAFTQISAFTQKPLVSLARNTVIPLKFEKNGVGTLYYTAEMKYALPDEMHSARDEGFKVLYEIIDVESGEKVSPSDTGIYQMTLEAGKTYKAMITLSTTRDRTYVALRAPIPSGAEILDATFVTSGSSAGITQSNMWRGRWMSNQVLYDNEARFFWNSYAQGESTLTFTFRTARRGVYPVPPVQAECMYEPEIFGRSNGYLYIIK